MRELLTTKQASELFDLPPAMLRGFRQRDDANGPAFYQLSPRSIRYDRADLQNWVDARRIGIKAD